MFQQQLLHITTTTTMTTATDAVVTPGAPTTTTSLSCSTSSSDPWCQSSSPYSILFVPQNANYNTWLFVLCVYHHIPNFRRQFLDTVENLEKPAGSLAQRQRWYINRLHFPQSLLVYREAKKIQNIALLSPKTAREIASFDDDSNRLLEDVNKVSRLDVLANSILPPTALALFSAAIPKKRMKIGDYIVQAPVGTMSEARLYLRNDRNAAVRHRITPTTTTSTPTSTRGVLSSSGAESNNIGTGDDPFLYFVRSVAGQHSDQSPESPSLLHNRAAAAPDDNNDNEEDDQAPGLPDVDLSQEEEQQPSPLKNFSTIQMCSDNIVAGYEARSTNFATSLKAYRGHHRQSLPIEVDGGYLYPCTNPTCDIDSPDGFIYLKRKLRVDHPQICGDCLVGYKSDSNRKRRRIQRSVAGISRMPPINSMDTVEAKDTAYKLLQLRWRKERQTNVRLRAKLERKKGDPTVVVSNVEQATSILKTVYAFLSSKKEKVTKIILETVIQMETSERILADEHEDERSQYVDFIVSDILNACRAFSGNTKQFRFHPIMMNLATNIAQGLKFPALREKAPWFFPTVRCIQRNRKKVSTHEGTDPKLYVRVQEMSGFTNIVERQVQWMFDEVKLTSGVMWNAKNDDMRGLCCGSTGSAEDLKDLLEDLFDSNTGQEDMDTDVGPGRDGIYCNQWLARNPYGATFIGEFFYNNGDLDGNEVMRQYLQVTTSAALMNLQTVGLLSDMGGANDRFYSYLRDGRTIDNSNLWPTDHIVVKNPVTPEMKLHTWSCSTHGLKNMRSQVEMSRGDGSGSRLFQSVTGVPFGWWTNRSALARDVEREHEGGVFRTSLSNQSVDLDSFTKMNASLAKKPFTEQTLSSIIDNSIRIIGPTAVVKVALLKTSDEYQSLGSGEKLRMILQEVQLLAKDLPERNFSDIASDLSYLELAVTIHRIYIQRLMNMDWGLTLSNIDAEVEQLKDCLQYFEYWQLGIAEYKKTDVSITRKNRERMFISTQTYRNMKFSICGFVEYARYMLSRYPESLPYVNAGHSNTSALESRFSVVKRSGLNDSSKYHHFVTNSNTMTTLNQNTKSAMKKRAAGSRSYPAQLIVTEVTQPAQLDTVVGEVVGKRIQKVDCYLQEWSNSSSTTDSKVPAIEWILKTPRGRTPRTNVCQHLLTKLQVKTIPEGNFVEMLRNDQTVLDLMVLTVEAPEHWDTLTKLFSDETGAADVEQECRYLVELSFQLLDEAVAAAKLSYKSSFWWQVMNRMRNRSVHNESPNPVFSNLVRSYLFQMIADRLMKWAREVLKEGKKATLVENPLVATPRNVVPGRVVNWATVGMDVNTFVGFAFFP
jgi:hypothetical protein